MISVILPVSSLLLGMAILLAGSGLVGTLLGLRASVEGFSGLTIGLIMSGFFGGYIVGAFVCPPLIRRIGHIRAFTAMAALSAAVSLLYGMVVDPWVWWALRVAHGVAMVAIYMVIESWLNEQMHDKRGKIFAAYMMVSFVALGLGQFMIAIYGAEHMGSFALVAIFYCIGLIPIALTPVDQPTPIQTPSLPLVRLYRVSPVGFMGGLVSGLVSGAFWGLSAPFAAAQQLDDFHVAIFTAAAIFGGAFMQWPVGYAAERRDRRVVLTGVCLLAALSALGMFIVGQTSTLALVACAGFFGGFAFTLYSLAVAQTHDRFHSSEALEATKALLVLHGAGAVIGPVAAGGVMSALGARSFPLVLVGMLVVLALFTLWCIRRDAPVPEADRTAFLPVNRTSAMAMEMDPRTPDSSSAAAD
ncbi:MFS transporter [Denitromonas iodatirespirans]|uniref:MFS transporter n=1 Tax=Denitromonas iodatirespirans TaxID=2795389 RepID=A0A944D532_DENI1|nr:MFS transporter [Denitromonas iodatirespirans]MBT0960005.1 MFS transporter [Denitromonas iodatirespirans]